MFTIVNNKVYVIEKDKMFPVNVSIENGVEKVGEGEKLPEDYPIYTLREIQIKFGIEKEKPYYFDKDKYEKDLAEAKEQKEAAEKQKLKEEVIKELEESKKEKPKDNSKDTSTNNDTKKE